jgi:hypothetical protein
MHCNSKDAGCQVLSLTITYNVGILNLNQLWKVPVILVSWELDLIWDTLSKAKNSFIKMETLDPVSDIVGKDLSDKVFFLHPIPYFPVCVVDCFIECPLLPLKSANMINSPNLMLLNKEVVLHHQVVIPFLL